MNLVQATSEDAGSLLRQCCKNKVKQRVQTQELAVAAVPLLESKAATSDQKQLHFAALHCMDTPPHTGRG